MESLIEDMLGDDELADSVSVYLPAAKAVVIDRLWPYDTAATWDDVPERFHYRTCEICCYLIAKRGGEGETRHVENGTTREWESASVPESMLTGMVPHIGVPE